MPLTIPDQTIANQVQSPNQTSNISNMLNIANQAQYLKKAQATFGSDVAERQAQASSAQSRATVDAANTQPLIDQQAAATNNAKFVLNKNYTDTMLSTATGLLSDPRITAPANSYDPEQAQNALTEAMNQAEAKGVPKAQALLAVAPFVNAIHTPGAVAQMLKNTVVGQMGPQGQQGALTQSGPAVSNGIQSAQINTNPLAAPVGLPVPGTTQTQYVPLSQQQTTVQDPQGNPYVQNKNAQGVITGVIPMPGQASPGTPGAFPHMYPGQADDIKAAQNEVNNIRAQGDQVGTQANINHNILALSRDTSTGPGTPTWNKYISGLSLGSAGSSYQELGKYLEKNAISSMQAMGGSPSDARLQAASAANGSTSFNPKALQEVTKFNDAATTALGAYRQGVDKAVGLQNPNYAALPAFKSAWAQNLDPNVFRVENAIRDGDTMELQRIKTELGPQGMQALAQKRLNLQTLSQTGRLPQ